MMAPVTKIQKFSLHDGPGIRTTIFLEGCPLSCDWCQNPETIQSFREILFYKADCIECCKCVDVCPEGCFQWNREIHFNSSQCNQDGVCIANCPTGALKWSSVNLSVDEVLDEVLKDKPFYDSSGGGVTFSGGEPLIHHEFCVEFSNKAKQHGLHVAIDTCALVSSSILEKVMKNVDLFLFDLKFIDEELHLIHTHDSNIQILKNFEILFKAGKKIEVRVPIIPQITDTKENLDEIEKFVRSFSPDIKIVFIDFNQLCIDKYKMIGKDFKCSLISV